MRSAARRWAFGRSSRRCDRRYRRRDAAGSRSRPFNHAKWLEYYGAMIESRRRQPIRQILFLNRDEGSLMTRCGDLRCGVIGYGGEGVEFGLVFSIPVVLET